MKLIITKGLPASGKSTWAKKMVDDHKYKRINRDSLREMIDNGKWSGKNEKRIVDAEERLAELYLESGCNVIIDDTNLSPSIIEHWENFAIDGGYNFEIKNFTDVPLDECIRRDQKRPNYVGEKVIKRMYMQFLFKPTPRVPEVLDRKLPSAYIFDLDGSLALHNGRSPFDYSKVEEDTVNESLRIIMNRIDRLSAIFLVSGRPDSCRDMTERWLKSHEIEYTALFMRKTDDNRNDSIIKREIYEAEIKDKYQVMGWFDDRLRVCREIHALGLPLFRVGDPDADF